MIYATAPLYSNPLVWRFILFVFALSTLFFVSIVQSSPGAHGPNGEHLDMEPTHSQAQRPKFEAFTESFEILGELFEDEMIIYLHDFKTNTPIAGAKIEIELNSHTANATYDNEEKRYRLKNEGFLSAIKQAGQHEIIVTILAGDKDDLLFANLTIPTEEFEAGQHGDDHADDHHHFPWWAVGVAIIALSFGFILGRKNWRAGS